MGTELNSVPALGVMGYLAVQILAMAVVMQSIINSVGWFGSTSLLFCMAVSSAVLIFYCVTGGIIASVYTDVIQGFAIEIPWGIHGGFIALLVSMISFIVISLLQTPEPPAEDIDAVMDM